MKRIAIVTDSSAYIPESSLVGLNVSVIPLWLLWEEESFRDGLDIDPATFNIDPAEVQRLVSLATKAILPVHLYGRVCHMDRVMEIAEKHDL